MKLIGNEMYKIKEVDDEGNIIGISKEWDKIKILKDFNLRLGQIYDMIAATTARATGKVIKDPVGCTMISNTPWRTVLGKGYNITACAEMEAFQQYLEKSVHHKTFTMIMSDSPCRKCLEFLVEQGLTHIIIRVDITNNY